MIHNQPLPHNLKAEAGVLGIILSNNDSIGEIIGELKPKKFYLPKHQRICEAMIELYKKDICIDLTTLSEKLKPQLKQIGGITYLAKLQESFSSIDNIKEYHKIVKEKSALREIITILNNTTKIAYEEQVPAKQIIEDTEDKLFNISLNKSDNLVHVSQALEEFINNTEENYKKGGGMVGIATQFYDMDRYISGIQQGDLIVVAARPSMGKTAFALNLAQNISKQDKAIAIFSLEMSRLQLIQRLVSAKTIISLQNLKNSNLRDEEWRKIGQSTSKIAKEKLHIDDTSELTVNEIKAKCKKLKLKKGLDIVIIDYIGLIKGEGENRTQEISKISRQLKNMAKELKVTVVALAQLNRGPEQRIDHRPMLADLRESGSIEQDADIVMFLYRDEYYNQDTKDKEIIECIIAKNRNGIVGTFKLAWVPKYQKISNISNNEKGGK